MKNVYRRPPRPIPPSMVGLVTVAIGAAVGILLCLALGLAL